MLKQTDALIKTGRIFYGICTLGLGLQQFIYKDFRPVIMPEGWPSWAHYPILAYLVGAALAIAGAMIVLNKNARKISLILAAFFLLFFIAFHIPYVQFVLPYKFHLGLWTNPLKELALSGGALVTAGSLPGDKMRSEKNNFFAIIEKLIPAGRVFFSITMISFGIDHFLYLEFVASLVPSWIPNHNFWSYFAGVALIGSGVSIIFNILRREVGILLAIMLFIWLVILHIPRAVTFDHYADKGNEITSVFECLGFCGIAIMIALVYKTKPSGMKAFALKPIIKYEKDHQH